MKELTHYLTVFEEGLRNYAVARLEMQQAGIRFGAVLTRARLQHSKYRRIANLSKALEMPAADLAEEMTRLEQGKSSDMLLAWRVAHVLEMEDVVFPDPWTQDEKHPLCDWQFEVANDNTRLGYIDWVLAQRESGRHDRRRHKADDTGGVLDQPTQT